jgi:hypothetical protein
MALAMPGGRGLFVQVPKSGSTSVARALAGWTKAGATHSPRSEVEDSSGRFAFAFVRNPWDRQLSYYRHVCLEERNAGQDPAEMRRIGFKGWLLGRRDMNRDDVLRKRPWPPLQRRPQVFYARGCDFIGRFEALQGDFDRACDALQLPRHPLPHLNATDHPPYREVYDDEMREAVAEWFAEDVRSFGYSF